MLTRSSENISWQHIPADVAIGADYFVDVGADSSAFMATDFGSAGQFLAPVHDLPFFSLQVITDDAVEVRIEIGLTSISFVAMATLVCAATLRANTIYDLPSPFNRDGFLIVTANYLRLRVINNTGNVVAPFHLTARAWR